ncbi:hypothetical protein E2C01_039536 [Portunus trituberculatus]|uniref:Uncharacterized protein n=1 Tax=Portunus trituberculatus TaxID=210409 RepID=A0A5B7FDW3_PORTR|nr:hypothetical protein [Portunus trituberculatus]
MTFGAMLSMSPQGWTQQGNSTRFSSGLENSGWRTSAILWYIVVVGIQATVSWLNLTIESPMTPRCQTSCHALVWRCYWCSDSSVVPHTLLPRLHCQ